MMRAAHVCAALLLAALLMGDAALAEPKAKPDNTCRSAGVLKFDQETHPMQRSKGMEVCSKYRKNTCCNASHSHALRLKIREPVVAKFGRKCQRLTEEMACSSCHPLMGTWQMKNMCPSLCNDWYDACKDEYYAYGGAGTLVPCYGNALVCSPLSAITKSGADFCVHMGFHVGSDADAEGIDCFDGSVPEQLGEAEPTEPWQVQLKRMLEEEAENPSGLFIAGVFILATIILMGGRIVRQFGDPFGGDQLSLMEVRRLQQERYERGEQMYDDETDSSSDDEYAPRATPDDADDENEGTSTPSSS
ncbi:RxLR-like protein [Phytophthora cinnamomi]|uniref:RxLR-like protein n=1 Tax=Phytophthora cinnamomi TaxID=4785 RepID=UPI00355A8A54|nr:RxLR-like protein [Phytophthora cinnamomi]